MRTRTTGRAGQQQARSPRAGGLYQSAWSSGAVRAVRSSENLPDLTLRRGNLILIQPVSDSRDPSQ